MGKRSILHIGRATCARRCASRMGSGIYFKRQSALVRQHPAQLGNQVVLNSLPRPRDGYTDAEFLLTSVGKFWLAGGQIDWAGFYKDEQRRRIPLPTYPFERQRYYIEPGSSHTSNVHSRPSAGKKADVADWFYLPSWRQFDLPRLARLENQRRSWLIFCDEGGVGEALGQRLKQQGDEIVIVHAGDHFRRTADLGYTLNPGAKEDYDALMKELVARGIKFQKVIHLWSLDAATDEGAPPGLVQHAWDSNCVSVLHLIQSLGACEGDRTRQEEHEHDPAEPCSKGRRPEALRT